MAADEKEPPPAGTRLPWLGRLLMSHAGPVSDSGAGWRGPGWPAAAHVSTVQIDLCESSDWLALVTTSQHS